MRLPLEWCWTAPGLMCRAAAMVGAVALNSHLEEESSSARPQALQQFCHQRWWCHGYSTSSSPSYPSSGEGNTSVHGWPPGLAFLSPPRSLICSSNHPCRIFQVQSGRAWHRDHRIKMLKILTLEIIFACIRNCARYRIGTNNHHNNSRCVSLAWALPKGDN